MQDLYKDIPCLYFSSTAEGVITRANSSLCDSLGYSEDELVGCKVENIFSLATRIFQQTHLNPLLELKGHTEEIYITLRSKAGMEVPVLINAARKIANGQTILHYAGLAINKRKQFEEEIIAAKKAAEKALQENSTLKAAQEELQQRAEELDVQIVLANLQNQDLKQFNHLATHTLQEPLRKLLLFSNQILETDNGSTIKTASQRMRTAAEDMSAKLKGLQQYAWLATGDLAREEVNLAGIIDTARKELELENPGIDMRFEYEAIPLFDGDSRQLLSLMKELLANAVRFRRPGNLVNVSIRSSVLLLNSFRQLSEKYKYREFIKLEIQDTGIGFDDSYQEQAFELFRTLHPTGGIGIGLPICKKIVESHGGSISLESQAGVGTTVVIFLPLKQVAALL